MHSVAISAAQSGLPPPRVQLILARLACQEPVKYFQGCLHAISPDVQVQDALSHAEMLRLYQSADVYVSPYRSEGFGLGTLEALTLGLQVSCCWSPSCMNWLSDVCMWNFGRLCSMHIRMRDPLKRGTACNRHDLACSGECPALGCGMCHGQL